MAQQSFLNTTLMPVLSLCWQLS